MRSDPFIQWNQRLHKRSWRQNFAASETRILFLIRNNIFSACSPFRLLFLHARQCGKVLKLFNPCMRRDRTSLDLKQVFQTCAWMLAEAGASDLKSHNKKQRQRGPLSSWTCSKPSPGTPLSRPGTPLYAVAPYALYVSVMHTYAPNLNLNAVHVTPIMIIIREIIPSIIQIFLIPILHKCSPDYQPVSRFGAEISATIGLNLNHFLSSFLSQSSWFCPVWSKLEAITTISGEITSLCSTKWLIFHDTVSLIERWWRHETRWMVCCSKLKKKM